MAKNTPENQTKRLIYNLLAKYDIQSAAKAGTFTKADGWWYPAVQGPMSIRGIPDIVGTYKGLFFAVEAKAPGKTPTGFQALQIEAIKSSGGAVFVVDGSESLGFFEEWLKLKGWLTTDGDLAVHFFDGLKEIRK